jgi:cyclopropane fatty-acyl-phospholipid synthase-like methyltransferase
MLDAVRPAGGDPDGLTLDDLASLDERHDGGRASTRARARFDGVRAGETVLDLGCGLGGPARTLAAESGCRLIGLAVSACRAWMTRTGAFGLAHE